MKLIVFVFLVLGVLGKTFGKAAIPQCLPALANYLQSQETQLNRLQQDLQATKQELQRAKQSIGKWPAGSYCILASGSCPPGFTKKSGHMRALNMFSHTAVYIKPVVFGSSKIQCHGPCGRYGNWVGDLYIAACCK